MPSEPHDVDNVTRCHEVSQITRYRQRLLVAIRYEVYLIEN